MASENPLEVLNELLSLLVGRYVPTKIIGVKHTDDLSWYITSNQQGKMFVLNLNRIVRKQYVTPRQFPYCTIRKYSN